MNNEDIVGFENDTKNIIQLLIRGKDELDVIPIIGMGGQGKTTCARKLYHDESVVSHFDVLAWCVISQTYIRRELLQEILSQVTGSKDMVEEDNVLADKLKKRLMGKRYLIVLDDLWDGKAWDELRFCFPECKKGSRLIVTTRLKKVGEQVKHHTNPYFLPFLKPEESFALLQEKVFQKEGCPRELQDVCLATAKRCNGLPLVVILVAGIIKKKKMEISWWNEVENALFSNLAKSDQEYAMATVQLSYDNLPDHIRPCFLYMGMYPEDKKIAVSKLINLWIAEGFVESIESGRLEEAAEGYLMDLISSNLVMVLTRTCNGRVKYCQVHDIVLHFCLKRMREEKFMSVVKMQCNQFEPLDWKENRISCHIIDEPSFILPVFKTRKSFNQHLRSFITHEVIFGIGPTAFPQIVNARLLIVLDLSAVSLQHLSLAALDGLIHLKYLEVYTEKFDFPSESHPTHLETLVVKGVYTLLLPAIFWKMEKLRHVDIEIFAFFDFHCLKNQKLGFFEESYKLENLRILKEVNVFPDHSVDALSRMCPNVEELIISIEDHHMNRTYSPNFEGFTHLQSLDIGFSDRILSKIYLPSSLQKLKIWCAVPITRRALSMMAKLPSLEYLRLGLCKFEHKNEWILGDIRFNNLKFLRLEQFRISRWDASEASFPQLERLVITRCLQLEEIPLSFAEIQTLKQIKVIRCGLSLEASALKIKEEVEEIEGNDRLNVIIKVSRNKFLSSILSIYNVHLMCNRIFNMAAHSPAPALAGVSLVHVTKSG